MTLVDGEKAVERALDAAADGGGGSPVLRMRGPGREDTGLPISRESREPRAESREPRAESREPRAEARPRSGVRIAPFSPTVRAARPPRRGDDNGEILDREIDEMAMNIGGPLRILDYAATAV